MSTSSRYQRQKNYRDRQERKGNVRVSVLVPADRADEIKFVAKKLRDLAKAEAMEQ